MSTHWDYIDEQIDYAKLDGIPVGAPVTDDCKQCLRPFARRELVTVDGFGLACPSCIDVFRIRASEDQR